MRRQLRYTRWAGNYPPESPAKWIAGGHVTCNIQCHSCSRMVDVRLDALPRDQPWSLIGWRLVCTACCGAAGSVHIVPNWHHRVGHAVPFSKGWKV
jgi:hypothetical protein